jgi:hypothetical protein
VEIHAYGALNYENCLLSKGFLPLSYRLRFKQFWEAYARRNPLNPFTKFGLSAQDLIPPKADYSGDSTIPDPINYLELTSFSESGWSTLSNLPQGKSFANKTEQDYTPRAFTFRIGFSVSKIFAQVIGQVRYLLSATSISSSIPIHSRNPLGRSGKAFAKIHRNKRFRKQVG